MADVIIDNSSDNDSWVYYPRNAPYMYRLIPSKTTVAMWIDGANNGYYGEGIPNSNWVATNFSSSIQPISNDPYRLIRYCELYRTLSISLEGRYYGNNSCGAGNECRTIPQINVWIYNNAFPPYNATTSSLYSSSSYNIGTIGWGNSWTLYGRWKCDYGCPYGGGLGVGLQIIYRATRSDHPHTIHIQSNSTTPDVTIITNIKTSSNASFSRIFKFNSDIKDLYIDISY